MGGGHSPSHSVTGKWQTSPREHKVYVCLCIYAFALLLVKKFLCSFCCLPESGKTTEWYFKVFQEIISVKWVRLIVLRQLKNCEARRWVLKYKIIRVHLENYVFMDFSPIMPFAKQKHSAAILEWVLKCFNWSVLDWLRDFMVQLIVMLT